MAVLIDNAPPACRPNQKAQLLGGPARHASAPARSHSKLERPNSGESFSSMTKCTVLPSPRLPFSSPLSKPNLLRELSATQSVVSRLRIERDKWRAASEIQKRQLVANQRDVEVLERSIALLEGQNTALRAGHEEVASSSDNLLARLQETINENDKLAARLNDSVRATARLKKSDRAKGKVWQRNLRLKTMLQRYTLQDTRAVASDTDTEALLVEALALAHERIEELESKGGVWLKALDERHGSCDSAGRITDGDHGVAKLVEAEVVFRGVLDNATSKEQKEHWEDLLRD